MVEKKIANRLCSASGVSQHLGCEKVVLGLSGTCRAQPGLGLPVSPPRAVGWQCQGPSCALLAAVAARAVMCGVDAESFAVQSLLWSEMKLRN